MEHQRIVSITFLTALGALMAAACAASDPDSMEEVGVTSQAAMCGTDNRAAVTSLTFPRGAVGKLSMGCTGTIIGSNKVLTAQHCTGGSLPQGITFSPQFGILQSGTGPAASSVTRITEGRDPTDTEQYADWAVLTLGTNLQTQLGANYQQMNVVIPSAVPFSVSLIGYHQDLYSNRPGKESCTMNALANWDGKTLLHNCDVDGGASGGPLYRISGGLAQLVAVQSGHGADPCSGQNGNNAASGAWYSFAPDNAGGTAVAYRGDGRMAVYASDQDWTLIALREKLTTDPSSAWTPWNALDSGFSGGGRRMAAVNLADNRQEVWAINSSGQLRTRWQNSVDGGWSAWSTQSTPTNVKDVSVSGGNGITTHIFILGTDNVVRVAYKTGGASSAWSSWLSLGTVSNARSLSAVYFGGVHQVFVSSSAGARTAWGSGTAFSSLIDFGTSSGGFFAIGAGLLQDGRVNLWASDGAGALKMRIRAADGSSWTSWTTQPQANPFRATGFASFSIGRLSDGRQEVFGVGSDGNVFTIWQVGTQTFSSTWVRFYK